MLDLTANHGYVSLGSTHDTAEFAVHSIRTWLDRLGRRSTTPVRAHCSEVTSSHAIAGFMRGCRRWPEVVGLSAMSEADQQRSSCLHSRCAEMDAASVPMEDQVERDQTIGSSG